MVDERTYAGAQQVIDRYDSAHAFSPMGVSASCFLIMGFDVQLALAGALLTRGGDEIPA
jgi:hypothetical protein